METANLILDSLKVEHSHDKLLEEGIPIVPEPSGKFDRFLEKVKHLSLS